MVTRNCELVPADKEAGTKAYCLCGTVMPDIKTTAEAWWNLHIQKGI